MKKTKRKKVVIKTVADLNAFFKGKQVLITEGHPKSGEKTDFIKMVNKDGSVPAPSSRPAAELCLKVRTKSGELILESKYAFVVEKEILELPNRN